MKALVSVGLIFYATLFISPSYAGSNQFETENLDHATKVTLNDSVLIIRHPECAKMKSSVHFSPKQQNDKTTVTLECAGKSYKMTQAEFMEKAAHEELNLSDLIESK